MYDESVIKILTTNVITVQTNQKLSDVSRIFRENMIHHVPVLDGKTPVGIISTQDIFKIIFAADVFSEKMIDAILDHHNSIENVMTTDLVTLPINSSIKDVANILKSSKIHSVLITNIINELEGIVTSTDLIKYLYESISPCKFNN